MCVLVCRNKGPACQVSLVSDQERLACQAAAVTMVKLVSQLKTGGGSSFCWGGTWLRSGGFLVQDPKWTKHLQGSAGVPLSKMLNPNAHLHELVNPAQPPCDPPTGMKQSRKNKSFFFFFFCTSRVVKSGSVLVFL